MDTPPRRSILPGLVALAAFLLSMLLAGAFPLLDPDEGRNAEIAREMAAGGGLLVPQLAGMPYLEPPGLFWAAAAAVRAAGVVPWAPRVPAALAAALTLALMARAAQRRYGRRSRSRPPHCSSSRRSSPCSRPTSSSTCRWRCA